MKIPASILIVSLVLLLGCSGGGGGGIYNSISVNQNEDSMTSNWSCKMNGSIFEVYFSSGGEFSQYLAIHTDSGFARGVYSKDSTWGTSWLLLPSFWSGKLYQGAPISISNRVENKVLVLIYQGTIGGLLVNGEIRVNPPQNNKLEAEIRVTTSGLVTLDSNRNGEAFQMVKMSSMRLSNSIFDTDFAMIGQSRYEIPEQGWVVNPAIEDATEITLVGGTSAWKSRAPTVELKLKSFVQSISATGWISYPNSPNDDNVSLWIASDQVINSFQYQVIIKE